MSVTGLSKRSNQGQFRSTQRPTKKKQGQDGPDLPQNLQSDLMPNQNFITQQRGVKDFKVGVARRAPKRAAKSLMKLRPNETQGIRHIADKKRNSRAPNSPNEAEIRKERKALNRFAIQNAYNQPRSPAEYEKRKEKLTKAIKLAAEMKNNKSPNGKKVPNNKFVSTERLQMLSKTFNEDGLALNVPQMINENDYLQVSQRQMPESSYQGASTDKLE